MTKVCNSDNLQIKNTVNINSMTFNLQPPVSLTTNWLSPDPN